MSARKTVFLNVPPRLQKQCGSPLRHVVRRAGQLKTLPRPLTVVVADDPMFDNGTEVDIFAYPLKARFGTTIMIRLNLRLFSGQSERAVSQHVATAVFHELIHVLRPDLLERRATVGDVIIEEGIATFFQTWMVEAPPFLFPEPQPRELRATARRYGRRLRQRHHPHEAPLRRISTTDERMYRFGYGLVQAYAAARPNSTWRQLLSTPRSRYDRFLRMWVKNLLGTSR